jgi:hypothetical protein
MSAGRLRPMLAAGPLAVAVAILAPVAGAQDATIGPSDSTPRVDHALVPISSVAVKVFAGRERDPETRETARTRVVTRVLRGTRTIARVRSAIVGVREYEDGELVESTQDYYAQRDDGSVFYMGERVDDYEDGRITGHGGQWYAGRRGAQPGLFMPVNPQVGQVFEQERAPGVAEDRSTVVDLDRRITTPAGRFSGCVKTRDEAPLDNLTEFKFYCPGVGLVREITQAGRSDLVSFRSR